MYSCNTIILPSFRQLNRITQYITCESDILGMNNVTYLKGKNKNLSSHDKIVSLLIDEIHVKPSVLYKNKTITGFASNKPKEEAKAMQAFMISSIFSSYKEIINLVPVARMTSKNLLDMILKVLEIV